MTNSALKPATGFLLIGFMPIPNTSTGITIDLVTPCRVRSPVTSRPAFVLLAEVLANPMVGNFSASKKSALFKCPSRFSFPVSILPI